MFRVFNAVISRDNIYRNRQRGLIYGVHIVIIRFVDDGKIFFVRHTLPRQGGADKNPDTVFRRISPELLLSSIRLSPPNESLMRFSR